MNYYSLQNIAPKVSFKEAVIKGIAPDKGLYFPERIKRLPKLFFEAIQTKSDHDIAFRCLRQFIGDEIDEPQLKRIIEDTLSFDFPIHKLTENTSVLELFHGPTMAFKDVGARFMARCLGYFVAQNPQHREITVLVATSGDTGGAVANGFLGVEGVNVVILYPSGKVSNIQERQLTTLGQNIMALEVDGNFDDCQAMVKSAFLDQDIIQKKQLTSANSINVARWLPQAIYFLIAYRELKHTKRPLVFSVPSGNFGNVCAALVAHRLGMPAVHFIASVNSNDVVPHFMKTGNYIPKPSVATISNAMDVGDPSNFVRIKELFKSDLGALSELLTSYSFSDDQTREAINELYNTHNYIADPHGAVGYLGLQKYLKTHPEVQGIFLETAHPVKFLDIVEKNIGTQISIPPEIEAILKKPMKAKFIKNYEEFKEFLLNS